MRCLLRSDLNWSPNDLSAVASRRCDIVNDVMQCFWFVPTGDLWRVDYQRLEEQPENATSNTTPEVTAQDGTASHFSLTCKSVGAFCVFDTASQTASVRLSGVVD